MAKKSIPKERIQSGAITNPPGNIWADMIKNPKQVSLFLMFFTFLLYANTLGHGYVQDDAIVISENMFTAEGIKGIPGLFKYDTFYGFFKEEGKAALVAGGRYRPLTPAMFALEVQVFGLNPFWGHLLNIIWYGFCVVIVYLLSIKLMSGRQIKNVHLIAFVLALVYAAHPVHTEVVANIKGRDEIMAMLFSFGAFYAILQGVDKKQSYWHWIGGLLLFLGLLSKENAITFLAVIPLGLWVFRSRGPASMVMPMLPSVAATLLFLFIRTSVLGQLLGSEPPKELMNNPFLKYENNTYVPFSSAEKSATITYTLGKYVQLMLFPYPLTHDYYPRQVGIMKWTDLPVILSLFLYLIMAFLAVVWSLRKNIYGFGLAFFLLTLSIVSNIAFPVGTNLSERFLFMPSYGFALMFAFWLVTKVYQKGQRRMFWGIAAFVVVAFSLKTIWRNPVWESNASLFLNDVKVSTRSAKLQNAAGGEKIRLSTLTSDESEKQKLLTEAKEHLKNAVEIHPQYKNAWLLMGNALVYTESYTEAVDAYKNALLLDPNYSDALSNIGIAYREAGKRFGEKENNLEKALEYLEQAHRYLPEDYETNRLYGIANAFAGRPEQALSLFEKAAELRPDIADAWRNLGNIYLQLGNQIKGLEMMAKAEAVESESARKNTELGQ